MLTEQEFPELKGKNMSALTKNKSAVIAPFKYVNEGGIDKITNTAFQAIVNKEKDINTALREADDALNKLIESSQPK